MTKLIKLQPEYRKGKFQNNYHQVPKLILSGNWLADAGFMPHQTVHVTVENGRMIITAREISVTQSFNPSIDQA
jgi:hypothetical protein